MRVVSAIGDNDRVRFPHRWPTIYPLVSPNTHPPFTLPQSRPEVSRHELDGLKREIQELKKLLIEAKKFDEETGQPECEVDEKVDLIRKIAKLVDVDMEDVFPRSHPRP